MTRTEVDDIRCEAGIKDVPPHPLTWVYLGVVAAIVVAMFVAPLIK